MVIDLEPEQQRVIDLAISSGAFHNSSEVISTALSMLAEDIEDGSISTARRTEPRATLAELEIELRSLGKLE
jgi:Arc/MetJ-type ribon-helix-helix transcriptional regulator